MYSGTLCLCLFVLAVVQSSYSFPVPKGEDDDCTSPGGDPGVCRRLSECDCVQEAIKRRSMKHTRCGFIGFEEVVCCVKEKPKRDAQQLKVRKSEQACQEYRKKEQSLVGYNILGGTETQEGEFPHMVALGYTLKGQDKISWRCGGTLISDQFIVTAAHCVTDRQLGSPVAVRLGQIEVKEDTLTKDDYKIERIILHPRYKKKFNYDDVALVKLTSKTGFNSDVLPACISTKVVPDNIILTATGWGAIDPGATVTSSRLLKADLTSVSLQTCQTLIKPFGKLPQGVREEMLCARDPKGLSDTCLGDSGGPLQYRENPSSPIYTVAGVTSFGSSPCGGKKPSIYVRLSHYIDWIESEVWP